MKLLTYDDLGDLVLLALSSRFAPVWRRSGWLRERLGDLDALLRVGRRRTVERSMALAFPEKSRAEIEQMARELFRRRWCDREIFWLRLMSRPRLADVVDREAGSLKGLEHLRGALSRGRGAIVWESPLGFRLLGTRALAREGFPIVQVHGPDHGGAQSRLGQAVFRRIHRAAESRIVPEVVIIQEDSTAYVELLMNRLRNNSVVCMAGFGTTGTQFIPLDFLGMRQYFATGIISLARVTGAALIPAFCFRAGGAQHLVLEEPADLASGVDRQELYRHTLERHSRMLAGYIRQYPEQWSRWHSPITGVGARAVAVASAGSKETAA
ncbi:MAG: hypothetical protein KIT09_25530 [Bryobacteraceae bacterium]|nr:hypothetical protein [Bryobacteraceae bacterium]